MKYGKQSTKRKEKKTKFKLRPILGRNRERKAKKKGYKERRPMNKVKKITYLGKSKGSELKQILIKNKKTRINKATEWGSWRC
jgi:hypothetical protein